MLVILENIIHFIYFVIAAIIGYFLVRNLFKRTTRLGIVYDIVYAYCVIPFLLRVLVIK